MLYYKFEGGRDVQRRVRGAGAARARRGRDAGAALALTRSRGPRGDNITRTSITTDQHLEDLRRRGPVARRIFHDFKLLVKIDSFIFFHEFTMTRSLIFRETKKICAEFF